MRELRMWRWSESNRLELMAGGMNDDAKQDGIEEFVGQGTGIRR